jgi:type III restriction enzyme
MAFFLLLNRIIAANSDFCNARRLAEWSWHEVSSFAENLRSIYDLIEFDSDT